MASGSERTVRLIIDAMLESPSLKDTCGGTTNAYRDKIPTPVLYPFFYLAESTDSFEVRNSETVKRGPLDRRGGKNDTISPSFRNEFLILNVAAVGRGGDLPYNMIEVLRQIFMDDPNRPNPFKATGTDPDLYTINLVTQTRQILLPTPFVDPDGKDLCQSTQTFIFSTIKNGAC